MIATLERSRLLAWLLVLTLTAPLAATAQPGGATATFTGEQLEQVAVPIALYPDPLLAQVLMASTYPLEIVQAARFVKDNPNLKAETARRQAAGLGDRPGGVKRAHFRA